MCLAAYTAAALLAVNSTLQQRNVSAAGTQLAFDTPKHTQCKKYQQPGQHCASCCRWKAAQLAKRRKAEQLAAQQQQQLAAAEREALQGWHRQKEQVRLQCWLSAVVASQ